MSKKKYNKGVNIANPLGGIGQFANIYAKSFKDNKAAKYGQIANNLSSVVGDVKGALPKKPKDTIPQKAETNIEGQTSDNVFGQYGMNVGEMMARKGMRVTKKKKSCKKKKR